MKATCPVCGYYGALEGFLANEDYKKALATICSFPGELPSLVIRYLGLFRKPGSDRAMTGSRVLSLSTQLDKLVKSEDIQWKGKRVLQNNPRYWAGAIKIILERDQAGRIERPLDGHNLLRCIAYDLAEKEFESALREKEERLRYRPDEGRVRAESEQEAKRPLPPEEALKRIKAIRAMLEGGGK